MAEIHGKVGGVFKGAAGLYTAKLVFGASNTIANAENLFTAAGFSGGQTIIVYGSTSNDGVYTIDTVADGLLTLDESTSSETATTSVLIYEAAPGTQVTGFYGWSLTHTHSPLETTDFADSGKRTYIAGDNSWTASAQAHWMTDEDVESLLGTDLLVRFFVRYSASPSAPAPVYLYEGLAVVTGLSVETAVGALVERPLQFTGKGPLVYRSYTAYP